MRAVKRNSACGGGALLPRRRMRPKGGCYGATGSKCSGLYQPIAMRQEPPGP
jgi:hypothetical protein